MSAKAAGKEGSPYSAPRSGYDLRHHGIENTGPVHWNLPVARLVEMAVARGEGYLTPDGALVVNTGIFTGRSPKDKMTVAEPSVKDHIWWGPVNSPFDPARFDPLFAKVKAYLQRKELFVFDGWVGADPEYRMGVRVVAEKAWHALFAHTLFLRPSPEELEGHRPDFTVIDACGLAADPKVDGTKSETFIVVSFDRKVALIGNTQYAGEMKKSMFYIFNYLLPFRGVLPMHCSANTGEGGDSALFFGLSGTGKTTLSADPSRRLVGDDEHGWSDRGIFNFEGGCYAKTIRLSREREPQIWDAIRFGSVLENVVVDPESREVDYDSEALTENTRATYPVEYIANCVIPGVGGHPRHVFFLACDAFGVLPPISKLTPEQAMYHFISGYTARVAGTERGLTKPEATFSSCFGAPFLALPPTRYAEMLGEKIKKHKAHVWLVNTGWSGGPAGSAPRMKLEHTRALLRAALSGELEGAPFAPDPVFGVLVPERCSGVPEKVLRPREAWTDKAAYDAKVKELAAAFTKNFSTKGFDAFKSKDWDIRSGGPRAS